ncbi:Phosphatidylglycerol--prolipoprotein diacylglyceryl transferase [Alphaproteobacteria bacterium]
MLAIVVPIIDPVLLHLGRLEVRWYGVTYAVGILLCCYAMIFLDRRNNARLLNMSVVDSLILYVTLGIIFGGRVGYVLFYHPDWFLHSMIRVFKIWEGGMSFHGGLIGIAIAIYVLCRRHTLPVWQICDMFATTVPIGLFLGRIANFINVELCGRITDVPWGVIFPQLDNFPRHPSQIYEAMLEGVLLFVIMLVLYFKTHLKDKSGSLSGTFLIGYAIIRMIVENYRAPDQHIGFIIAQVTLGQILSVPMLLLGVYIIFSKMNKNVN